MLESTRCWDASSVCCAISRPKSHRSLVSWLNAFFPLSAALIYPVDFRNVTTNENLIRLDKFYTHSVFHLKMVPRLGIIFHLGIKNVLYQMPLKSVHIFN